MHKQQYLKPRLRSRVKRLLAGGIVERELRRVIFCGGLVGIILVNFSFVSAKPNSSKANSNAKFNSKSASKLPGAAELDIATAISQAAAAVSTDVDASSTVKNNQQSKTRFAPATVSAEEVADTSVDAPSKSPAADSAKENAAETTPAIPLPANSAKGGSNERSKGNADSALPDTGLAANSKFFVKEPPRFFADLWQKRLLALQLGDQALATKLLTELIDSRRQSGWPDALLFGKALAYEGLTTFKKASLLEKFFGVEPALELCAQAIALAPHDLGNYVSLASIQLVAPKYFFRGLATLSTALAMVTHELSLLHPFLANLMFGALGALLVALGGLLVVFLKRYLHILLYDWRYLAGCRLLIWPQVLVLIFLAILLPIAGGLGLFLTLSWWFLLLARYYSLKERLLVSVLFLGLLGGSFWLQEGAQYFAYLNSASARFNRLSYDLQTAEDAPDGLKAVTPNLKTGATSLTASDPLKLLYLQGMRAYWSGNLAKARYILFSKALAVPAIERLAAYHTVLGDLHWLAALEPKAFMVNSLSIPELTPFTNEAEPQVFNGHNIESPSSEKQQAILAYERALQLDPKNISALYNLSRVYHVLKEYQRARALYQRALEVDKASVLLFTKDAKAHGANYIIPADFPTEFRDYQFTKEELAFALGIKEHLWAVFAGDLVSNNYFSLYVLGFLALLWLLGYLKKWWKVPEVCEHCGAISSLDVHEDVDSSAGASSSHQRICFGCYYVYRYLGIWHREVRYQRELFSQNYLKVNSFSQNMLKYFPAGLWQILVGHTFRGFIFLYLLSFFVLAAILAFVAPQSLFILAALGPLGGFFPAKTFGILMLAGAVVVYLFSMLDTWQFWSRLKTSKVKSNFFADLFASLKAQWAKMQAYRRAKMASKKSATVLTGVGAVVNLAASTSPGLNDEADNSMAVDNVIQLATPLANSPELEIPLVSEPEPKLEPLAPSVETKSVRESSQDKPALANLGSLKLGDADAGITLLPPPADIEEPATLPVSLANELTPVMPLGHDSLQAQRSASVQEHEEQDAAKPLPAAKHIDLSAESIAMQVAQEGTGGALGAHLDLPLENSQVVEYGEDLPLVSEHKKSKE